MSGTLSVIQASCPIRSQWRIERDGFVSGKKPDIDMIGTSDRRRRRCEKERVGAHFEYADLTYFAGRLASGTRARTPGTSASATALSTSLWASCAKGRLFNQTSRRAYVADVRTTEVAHDQ